MNTIFIRKDPELSEDDDEENEEENETYISELLNDEYFEKFLKECKLKFKNNLKNLYTMLNKERSNNESINENEINEENEIDDSKYFPEDIDELIEERIKDKYFKNLARFLIANKLNKKKKKKLNYPFTEEDFEFSNDDEENNEENEIDEEINSLKNKHENLKKQELKIKFDKETFYNFCLELAYFLIDIGLTYSTICLLLLFIFQLEQNIFILLSYYVILIFLLARVRLNQIYFHLTFFINNYIYP